MARKKKILFAWFDEKKLEQKEWALNYIRTSDESISAFFNGYSRNLCSGAPLSPENIQLVLNHIAEVYNPASASDVYTEWARGIDKKMHAAWRAKKHREVTAKNTVSHSISKPAHKKLCAVAKRMNLNNRETIEALIEEKNKEHMATEVQDNYNPERHKN